MQNPHHPATTRFKELYQQETLFRSLLRARQRFGKGYRVISEGVGKSLNYEELITRSYALGQKIKKKSQRGDHIGLLLPNSLAAVIAFFALQAYARIPTLLNFSAGTQIILISCQLAQVSQVYSSRQFIEEAKLHDLISALENRGIKVIYLEDLVSNLSTLDKLQAKLKTKMATWLYKIIETKVKPSQEALILFTSGSEGTPKGVALSHLNIQANRAQAQAVLDLNSEDILLNVLPLFHSFGLTAGLLLPVLSGIKTVLYLSPLHYQTIPSLIHQTKTTVFFATDTFLQGYAHYANARELSSLRLVFAGAEKLKESTRKLWLDKFGIELLEGYGTTETAPILSLNLPAACKAGTVGRLLPHIDYQLLPVAGTLGGRLEVSGPNVMLGYYHAQNPGLLAPSYSKHDTGDIVCLDDDGFITLIGRAKRFIKIAGEMISLQVIEEFIHQLWPETQHAILTITHPRHGETLVLVTTHVLANRGELVNFARTQGLTELMCPKRIIILKNLPLLASGKINYEALKEYVA